MSSPEKKGGQRRRPCLSIETSDGARVEVSLPEPADDTESKSMALALNPGWHFLSPLTLRIVRVLCQKNWLTKDEIAVEVNEQPEGDIRPMLADLVKRGVLESSPRKGYMIAIPETSNPDEYRRRLALWLDAEEKTMPNPDV